MNFINTKWTKKTYEQFISYLLSLQDTNYQKFQQNIISNCNIIGVRTPILKKIAKDISKGSYNDFFKIAKNDYYEENIIYGLIITNLKSIEEVKIYLPTFMSKIDNWACNDIVISNLKIVNKNKNFFYKFITINIKNKNQWTKRFCYVLLLNYFIEEKYLNKIFTLCEKYNDDNYYVNMAVAWLLSICYIKYPKQTITFLKENKLDKFTHNKAIQKIVESNRIKNKEEIKLLKRK